MHTRDTHCPQVRPPSSSSSHPLCLLSASPSRDCNQLKPNINSALDACKGLVSAFGEVIKAQHNFARSLTGLIEAQDCQIEKEIVREVQTSTVRALPLLGEIVTTLQHQVLEPLQFFEVDTMSIAASSVSDINKMTPKAGKKYFQYHREAITDWNSFRRIRHDMLISSIYTFAQSSLGQVDHPLLLSPPCPSLSLSIDSTMRYVGRGRRLCRSSRSKILMPLNSLPRYTEAGEDWWSEREMSSPQLSIS
jgi:hypothetical protein